MENEKYNYYELVFTNKEDPLITSSMCVLGTRKPSIEEAKEFWKKDCSLYQDEELTEVIEVSYEEAHEFYDMSNEQNFPIFK